MSVDLATLAAFLIASVAALAVCGGLLVPRRLIEQERHELRALHDRSHFVSSAFRVPPHEGHEIVPVETGGEVVARLCVTCDEQLSAEERP